jgi:hypothetical protein
MSTDASIGTPLAQRVARVITEILAPAVWAAAMPVIIAVHAATNPPAGVAWGALAALFSSVIPYGVIWIGVRRGRLTDHHIGRREQRRVPLLIGLASVLVGLAMLVMLRAPHELVAMVTVMLVVLLGTTVVNQFWKLSAHTAVSAGSVTVLVLVFGPTLLAAVVCVALVGWSRVVLPDRTGGQTHDHSVGQVLAGVALGVVLAGATFVVLG